VDAAVRASYRTPARSRWQTIAGPRGGRSVLSGVLVRDGAGAGGQRLEGTWEHEGGPLSKGTFELRWDAASGGMRGWWKEEGRGDVQHEWAWLPARSVRARVHGFVHGKGMEVYTVACCWLFAVQTLVQTAQALTAPTVLDVDSQALTAGQSNLAFNSVFTVAYASFLLAFYLMRERPAATYVLGVVLYTLGYLTFVVYFGILEAGMDWGLPALYLAGAQLFLLGSMSLVIATAPKAGETWSPTAKSAALLWGSAAFLAGSVFFTVDASQVLSGEPYSRYAVSTGYGCFTAGRFYFLWGCTTPRVGVCFHASGRAGEEDAGPGRRLWETELAARQLAAERPLERRRNSI